ncbi:MAG: proline--tRNA ligase [Propionibacteriaceae bacterium]|nr:proline--tRNA ligase [Propionibacteriaceae bacterium]
MTRLSSYFVRTLRQDPADAEVPSHKWLVRAGYIRRVAPGLYSWLPLGLRVMHKIEKLVREEMDACGAIEVRFPGLLPREPYELTQRWTDYGDTLFRLQDRKGADYLLGPTHEEFFTLLVKDLYSSYKDLPLTLYQIQTKYRDEARPRAGLLRCREFVMKDAYTFDIDDAGLAKGYQNQRDAYIKIFDRLGIKYVIVTAMSGAMGGSRSEEFLALAENGEDTFVQSPGGFAANAEAVRFPLAEPVDWSEVGEIQVVDTPGTGTIIELVEMLNQRYPCADRVWEAGDTLKNVAFMLTDSDGSKTPLIIGLPGDREVDAKRLAAAVEPAIAEPFTDADFAAYPQLTKGYIGSVLYVNQQATQVLGEQREFKIRYLTDPRVGAGSAWVTGANVPDQHQLNVVAGRDFAADGIIDVAEIHDGDPAPDGSGPLSLARGIEIGHVFQLGRKYADALGLQVLDQNGKLVTVTMGSYGLGVSRLVATIAETTCDEKGLAWPRIVAPFDVHIIAAGKDEAVLAAAEELAAKLDSVGVEVILDDRKVSPGVKFADGELLGIPTLVVIGRGLATGVVEVRDRASGASQEVPVEAVYDHLISQIRNELPV